MRKLVYVSSTILFSLLISGCFHDDDDNPQPINNENYAGIWAGSFYSDIVEDSSGGGLFSIANNGETYFTSVEEEEIAFTATYQEKLPSEIYDAQEIVDYLAEDAADYCEEYENAGYINNCSEITAANLDTKLGPIFEGTDITWYKAGVKLETDPVFGTFERVSGPEVPIHIGFPVIDDDDIASYIGEIDQALLLTPSTPLYDAETGDGGGDFLLPSSDAPVLLSALAGDWEAMEKFAGIEIQADGSFEGGDIAECYYAGQITERENDAYIFDATLTVDCDDGSVFDGAYTGILVAVLDESFLQLVVTGNDGFMISQGFEEFGEMIIL